MNRVDVAAVLAEFKNHRWESSLHGFTLLGVTVYRLIHGGGIACRSHVWWIERLDGSEMSRRVETKAQLRKLMREHFAEMSEGSRPLGRIDHNGYLLKAYAKQHTYLGNTNWVWIYRKTRAFACCGGSDEHPPEHTADCPVKPGGGPLPKGRLRRGS